MKILAICCSPRKKGNTEILLKEALAAAKKAGAEVEFFTVVNKIIGPCLACGACRKEGICAQQDDMQPLYAKLLAADGVIFGTPVYYYNMTAQCKAVIDRTLALMHPKRNLHHKVGGIVVVGGSMGNMSAIKDIGFYFAAHKMLYAGFISAYGTVAGDVKRLPKCLEAARNLGKGMVKLTEMGFRYPPELMGPAFAYGTHTK